ncbi:MAG: hypothetical protein N3I86_03025 [Verrucomicrobiae bacterium]|nr:hypothetical protein [Verrucomicrobiae bacterium]MDW8308550.1 hypothetical protein [Verrucomicrobiales bacterium]
MANDPVAAPRRYRWPWFVWGAFLLGCVLAYFWMRAEVNRIRQLRQPQPTNVAPPPPTSQLPGAGPDFANKWD